MKTLSLDLETYSDVNLARCGVYKYAESPAFEILLFGYAVDGGEVQVIDLAQGETIPEKSWMPSPMTPSPNGPSMPISNGCVCPGILQTWGGA